MRKRTVKHKNITRVDHDKSRMHGYNVRIMWQGERRCRFFSDARYGDRLAALVSALDWRNATEKELGRPRTERRVVGIVYSTSGVPGVRLRHDGNTDYYEATWGERVGKQRRVRYSVTKHGAKRALRLAQQARERGEQARLRTPAKLDV